MQIKEGIKMEMGRLVVIIKIRGGSIVIFDVNSLKQAQKRKVVQKYN